MIEAVFLGLLLGFFAGLIPGIHTNLLAVVIAGLHFDVWFSSVLLVSLAVSRSVVDAVPTVFLGASEDVMALLPGHRLLKKGYGIEAVKFCVIGSVLGVVFGMLLIPFFLFVFPLLFSLLKPVLFWILLMLVIFLLFRDSWWAFVVFFLSGLLGLLVLNSVREPLFPLLSGLFGASGLLMSLFSRVSVPFQADTDVARLPKLSLFSSVVFGALAGGIVTLFPGLGPSQAAALSQIKRQRSFSFLVLVGALGTVDVLISLVTFFVVGKTRNGAVVIIEQLLGSISGSVLFYFVAVACVSVGFASVLALFASKWYAFFVELVDYSLISFLVLLFLFFMGFFLSGWLGVLVFITSTFVGMIAPLTNTSRSHAMGCLLLPTLILLW
ncbi:tripartite tricarboxylate transporter permease [Candidatus Woesearchaeota archaeon]|nr:tripartite tricarboxylate transporter permease [Candidatus Woesearchaeota archaeon]MBW3016377.1 tripartite tricarboxylate transporter permease [Candidatus Woesearchaeota archaeon]